MRKRYRLWFIVKVHICINKVCIVIRQHELKVSLAILFTTNITQCIYIYIFIYRLSVSCLVSLCCVGVVGEGESGTYRVGKVGKFLSFFRGIYI